MQKSNGFILFVVLLFLQLISAMGLYSLTSVQLNLKVLQREFANDKDVVESKNLLQQIENTFEANHLTCPISPVFSFDLSEKSLSWWESNACQFNATPLYVYYVIESLGVDACAQLAENERVADYYRLSTLIGFSKSRFSYIMMQATFVKPAQSKIMCTETLHHVKIGQQSFRFLRIVNETPLKR